MAAAAAAGRPVQLLRLGRVDLGLPPPGAAPDVAVETVVAMGVASLQAAYVTVGRSDDYGELDPRAEADAAAARVAALVARLPALRDLHLGLGGFSHPVELDFRAAPARLSRLVLTDTSSLEPASPEVRLSCTAAASLQVLAISSEDGYLPRPPACVRGMANALTALTRLEYGEDCPDDIQPAGLDLAAWGATAEYALPALRVLTVWSATGFTVEGQGGRVGPSGRDWVAGVLATLPRLERLTLGTGVFGRPGFFVPNKLPPSFSCRSLYWNGPAPCEHCRQPTACAGATAVRELIMHGLPAAAAAAGRRLAVVVHGCDVDPEWYCWEDMSDGGLVYGPAPR